VTIRGLIASVAGLALGLSSLACGGASQSAQGGSPSDGQDNSGPAGPVHHGGVPLSDGVPGEWEDVTPGGISFDPSLNGFNHGILDVVADPARSGVFYAGTYGQGIWKTEDWGVNWAKVSAGTNGPTGDTPGPTRGRNWGFGITSDGETLYTFSGAADGGLWKSTDHGVHWTQTWTDPTANKAGNDLYMIDIDPADDQHLLISLHGNAPDASYNDHVFESLDGGATWRDGGSTGAGQSNYVYFITPTTWLSIGQWGNDGAGTYRTTDSGAHWTLVGVWQHGHGASQIAVLPGGTVYLTDAGNGDRDGAWGVWKSTDYGAHFTQVLQGVTLNGVFTDGTRLFANYGWSSDGPNPPNLRQSTLTGDTTWSSDVIPADMTNGAKRGTVSNSGDHMVVMMGCYGAGIWRYIVP
jgi:hypothetical protein